MQLIVTRRVILASYARGMKTAAPILTSNKCFGDWGELMNDAVIAAMLDNCFIMHIS